jgi:uncharacterized protein
MVNLENRPEGVVIAVRVSAAASRDRVLGEHAGALKLSVSAPPERGKANAAVRALVAKTLGVAASHVSIVAGETSRDKKVLVRGADVETVRKTLSP